MTLQWYLDGVAPRAGRADILLDLLAVGVDSNLIFGRVCVEADQVPLYTRLLTAATVLREEDVPEVRRRAILRTLFETGWLPETVEALVVLRMLNLT